MTRLILTVIFLIALSLGAIWLAEHPGNIVINWNGYEITTSAVVAAVVFLAIALALVTLFMLVTGLLSTAAGLATRRQMARRRKGYDELSRGLLAVAAGAAPEARRHVRQAERLLDDPGLTRFLSAQTASLEGRTDEAEAHYRALLDSPDTEFLGLRALFVQAREEGNRTEALALARRAFALRKDAGWAAEAVFELECAEGDWQSALGTLDKMVSAKLLSRDEARHRRGLILTGEGLALEEAAERQMGNERLASLDRALKLAREAAGYEKQFAPTIALTARLEAETDHPRRGAKLIEEAWAKEPHPELAMAFADLRRDESAYDKLARVKDLVARNPDHVVSHVTLAEAAVAARDWQLARDALAPFAAANAAPAPTRHMCELMAMIEDGEHGNRGKAREWLARGLHAPEDPCWVGPGYRSPTWVPVNPETGAFDQLEWISLAPDGTPEYEALTPAVATTSIEAAPLGGTPEKTADLPPEPDAGPPIEPDAAAPGTEEAAPSDAPAAETDDAPAKGAAAREGAEEAVRLTRARDDPGPEAEEPEPDEPKLKRTWW